MKRTLILLLLCLSQYLTFGQQNNDSLWSIFKNNKQTDTLRLKAIEAIAKSFIQNKPDSAIVLANEQLKLAIQTNKKNYEARALNIIGDSYFRTRNNPKTLQYFTSALTIYKQLKDKREIGNSLNRIGNVYFRNGDLIKGIEYELEAIKIIQELGDLKLLAGLHMNVGNTYFNNNDFDKTIQHWSKSLNIYVQLKDTTAISRTFSAIGQAYTEKNDYNQATYYLKKALILQEKLGNQNDIFYSLMGLGDLNNSINNNEATIDYYKRALEIASKSEDEGNKLFCFLNISDYYLKNNNTNEATSYAQKSLILAKEMNNLHYTGWAAKILWQTNSKIGNYKDALFNYEIYRNAKDSISNTDHIKEFAEQELAIKEESNKTIQAEKELIYKEEQIKKEAELNRQKMLRNFFIFGFGFVIILVVIVFRSYRQKRKSSDELAKKNELIEEKNKDIIDSITYARRIQQSLLPTEKYIEKTINRLKKN